MNKRNTLLRISRYVVMFIFTLTVLTGIGQEPPHPPSNGHGTKGNQPAGSARLTDGISILVAFALAYGYRRFSKGKKAAIVTGNTTED